MSSPSLPLPSMSSFMSNIFSLTTGCPHTVSPHIQHLLTLLHPMWKLILLYASMSSPSLPLPSMSSFLKTIFLPHSRVPLHCFTSYSTSHNPPTPNVGINFFIRFYELSFSSSPFYELFSKDHFFLSRGHPHSVSPHIQHLLTLLHPMWGLFLSSASMSSPSFPLPLWALFCRPISLSRKTPLRCFT